MRHTLPHLITAALFSVAMISCANDGHEDQDASLNGQNGAVQKGCVPLERPEVLVMVEASQRFDQQAGLLECPDPNKTCADGTKCNKHGLPDHIKACKATYRKTKLVEKYMQHVMKDWWGEIDLGADPLERHRTSKTSAAYMTIRC